MKKDADSNKNILKTPPRKALTDRAIALWNKYHNTYSTLLSEYKGLLSKKRELGMRLEALPKSAIKDYPDIPFLRLPCEQKAAEQLKTMNAAQIEVLIAKIQSECNSPEYNLVRTTVECFRFQILYHGKKSQYGVNPDCIGTGRGVKNRSSGRNVRVDETK